MDEWIVISPRWGLMVCCIVFPGFRLSASPWAIACRLLWAFFLLTWRVWMDIGGWFTSSLHPTWQVGPERSTHCRGWDSGKPVAGERRLDVKHPPTAVGGIQAPSSFYGCVGGSSGAALIAFVGTVCRSRVTRFPGDNCIVHLDYFAQLFYCNRSSRRRISPVLLGALSA